MKVAVAVPSDEHRNVSDIDPEEVTCLRDRMRRARIKPGLAEDLGLLLPVVRGSEYHENGRVRGSSAAGRRAGAGSTDMPTSA